jgi:fructose transport system substrate-binding protein
MSHMKLRKLALAIAVMLSIVGNVTARTTTNARQSDKIVVGLITKTETNPFFVKMREGAQKKADELGVKLLTASGNSNTDNESQVTAIENMVTAGVKGILITPADTSAIVPTIKKARDAGVVVIALDTPTTPEDATDGLFATDNKKAGVLIGEYARAAMGDTPAKIATLDLIPGITVGDLRHNGFLEGFGIKEGDKQLVCSGDSDGDQAKGQAVMEDCLTKDPQINLVYAVNEPAALGAYAALDKAGLAKGVTIVAIDGGCTGVEGVMAGKIAATSQQYPLKMAALGLEAIVKYAKTGEKPTGYTDTGVTLITNSPMPDIKSENVLFGLQNCWGTPTDGAMDAAEKLVGAQATAEATMAATAAK